MPTFRKHEHLLKPAEFQQVYDRRRSASDAGLILYARENGQEFTRIGLSVSRKFGGAVQRNRLRRLYREAFRLSKDSIPTGLDLVLIPRSQEEPSLDELRKSLVKLAKQIHKKIQKDPPAAPEADSRAELG
jgi:ribonuclease P protein component